MPQDSLSQTDSNSQSKVDNTSSPSLDVNMVTNMDFGNLAAADSVLNPSANDSQGKTDSAGPTGIDFIIMYALCDETNIEKIMTILVVDLPIENTIGGNQSDFELKSIYVEIRDAPSNKSVSWKTDKNLEQVSYFEPDETEEGF